MAQQYFEETQIKETIAKSIYTDETELLNIIIRLHCPQGFELDPTYSTGHFYEKIQKPEYRYDLIPQAEGVIQADCRKLPIESGTINSIMFDPPFVAGIGAGGKTGIIRERFGSYKSIKELWVMYGEALAEFYRILKSGGVLVFKCQDSIDGGQQYLSHVEIINVASKLGFYPKDLFVLLAKNRIMGTNMAIQQHARKFHSYFLVFKKQKSKVIYTEPGPTSPLYTGIGWEGGIQAVFNELDKHKVHKVMIRLAGIEKSNNGIWMTQKTYLELKKKFMEDDGV